MSVCRKTSRVYCDVDDLNGVANVAKRMALETDDPILRAYLKGVQRTAFIFANHERVETQADFMPVALGYFRDEYDRSDV